MSSIRSISVSNLDPRIIQNLPQDLQGIAKKIDSHGIGKNKNNGKISLDEWERATDKYLTISQKGNLTKDAKNLYKLYGVFSEKNTFYCDSLIADRFYGSVDDQVTSKECKKMTEDDFPPDYVPHRDGNLNVFKRYIETPRTKQDDFFIGEAKNGGTIIVKEIFSEKKHQFTNKQLNENKTHLTDNLELEYDELDKCTKSKKPSILKRIWSFLVKY